MLYGIPYPGVYVCDEDGIVIAKFFHDTYKKRDSPEILIDAALGRLELAEDAPKIARGDDEVKVTFAVHGGEGSIRQGIIRHAVLRFELRNGLHIYAEPAPDGMVPLSITLSGPPGLIVHPPILPPTEELRLDAMDLTLNVWSGNFDVKIPFYPVGELASEVRPLDSETATVVAKVRFQACNDQTCLLPCTMELSLDLPMDVIDIPSIGIHKGHGQREGNYDGTPHLKRLMERKVRQHPLGFIRFRIKNFFLERAARRRKSR